MLIILPSNTDPRHVLQRRPPLKTPFAIAALAVIEAEPKYVRARLIELAAMVAAGDELEAVAQ